MVTSVFTPIVPLCLRDKNEVSQQPAKSGKGLSEPHFAIFGHERDGSPIEAWLKMAARESQVGK